LKNKRNIENYTFKKYLALDPERISRFEGRYDRKEEEQESWKS